MTMTITERVDRGVEMLTRIVGKERLSGVDRLNMASVTECVLGQLYGNYWTGLELINLEDRHDAADHGLICYQWYGTQDTCECDALTQAWNVRLQQVRAELAAV